MPLSRSWRALAIASLSAHAAMAGEPPHAPACGAPDAGTVNVIDRFDRPLGATALLLPDWEGYMANPAIRITVAPPPGAQMPIDVTVRSDDPLVHFDLPSSVDDAGAVKQLRFTGTAAQTLFVSTFPQRVKQHLRRRLHIAVGGQPRCSVPVEITPLAAALTQVPRQVTVDFSHDRTGFYDKTEHRALFQQALSDWTYYLDGSDDAWVRQGDEATFIWQPDGFTRGKLTVNGFPYLGHLLYAYGIRSAALRSGGAPYPRTPAVSALRWRSRSGTVEIEVQGNYNQLGWMAPDLPDRAWWRATNMQDVQNDLYSIMRHEIGHALFFNPGHPGFFRHRPIPAAPRFGVRNASLTPSADDHFDETIDPVSRRGMFGSEYEGTMPDGRWLITRADLLAIAALGGKLRPVAALLALNLPPAAPPAAVLGQPYRWQIRAGGGVPAYDWQLDAGPLPDGLTLDRVSGLVSGVPTRAGRFSLSVALRDSAETSALATRAFTIEVGNMSKVLRVVHNTSKLAATPGRDCCSPGLQGTEQ